MFSSSVSGTVVPDIPAFTDDFYHVYKGIDFCVNWVDPDNFYPYIYK